MAIKSVDEMPMSIDLTGPEGNAFCLIGYARRFGKQLGRDVDNIVARMKSSDYENLVAVFEQEFGGFVTLYR